MATRSNARTAIVRSVPMRAPAPIIRVSAPSAPRHSKGKGKHRRAAAGGKLNQKTLMGAAIGGAVMGFVDKAFPTLPTIPLLGRAGTIALAAYMLSGRGGIGGIARDVALAAAAVAGYELGKEGKVSGAEIMGGDIAPQVSGRVMGGLASQV